MGGGGGPVRPDNGTVKAGTGTAKAIVSGWQPL
jgi:hypothetical protein